MERDADAQSNPTIRCLSLIAFAIVINSQHSAKKTGAENENEYAHGPAQPFLSLDLRCCLLGLHCGFELRNSFGREIPLAQLILSCRKCFRQIVVLVSEHV